MFNSLPEDESLDASLCENPTYIEEFADSIIIFDDIDAISDGKIKQEVCKMLLKVLEIGRHFRCTALVTNHLPTNGKYIRRILREAHQVAYFPHSA